ncbi:lasso peptide biosynthesis B2 protein [Dyadobacter sp. CY312]|uniref:lasso peptide biosynthesis B2 protein n=1 Tax=Dyadobacter sp. CY312 TaxID=2907303 RepID=UPI001F408C59|nr:lasso peptide biosynthesis B2 protein [Dyadobacter sp. CY312]MCE7039820.1 lasso peptide biosynthesis B2 protein [Dyadobacter sp. CY312]
MKNFKTYWSRWQEISFKEKVAFFKASLSLTVIKFGLVVLPFSTFRKLYHWFSKTNRKKEVSREHIDTIVWAVKSAADHLPFELLCLPRALATKYLLRHVPALTLEIGVDITAAKVFEAHAWVEKNGSVIIGDWPETVSYQRLWVWE